VIEDVVVWFVVMFMAAVGAWLIRMLWMVGRSESHCTLYDLRPSQHRPEGNDTGDEGGDLGGN